MDEVRGIGTMVKRLQMRHHRAANAALADLGVSVVQWDALRWLHERPGASLHDLAVLTYQSDQAFGTLAARMAARGFVERVEGPGRAVRLRLTPEGDRVLDAGSARIERMLRTSFAPLADDDLTRFEAMLRRLLGEDAL